MAGGAAIFPVCPPAGAVLGVVGTVVVVYYGVKTIIDITNLFDMGAIGANAISKYCDCANLGKFPGMEFDPID